MASRPFIMFNSPSGEYGLMGNLLSGAPKLPGFPIGKRDDKYWIKHNKSNINAIYWLTTVSSHEVPCNILDYLCSYNIVYLYIYLINKSNSVPKLGFFPVSFSPHFLIDAFWSKLEWLV